MRVNMTRVIWRRILFQKYQDKFIKQMTERFFRNIFRSASNARLGSITRTESLPKNEFLELTPITVCGLQFL